jgi:hypothetical protein
MVRPELQPGGSGDRLTMPLRNSSAYRARCQARRRGIEKGGAAAIESRRPRAAVSQSAKRRAAPKQRKLGCWPINGRTCCRALCLIERSPGKTLPVFGNSFPFSFRGMFLWAARVLAPFHQGWPLLNFRVVPIDLELAPTLLRWSTSPTVALRQAAVAERPLRSRLRKGALDVPPHRFGLRASGCPGRPHFRRM